MKKIIWGSLFFVILGNLVCAWDFRSSGKKTSVLMEDREQRSQFAGKENKEVEVSMSHEKSGGDFFGQDFGLTGVRENQKSFGAKEMAPGKKSEILASSMRQKHSGFIGSQKPVNTKAPQKSKESLLLPYMGEYYGKGQGFDLDPGLRQRWNGANQKKYSDGVVFQGVMVN